MPGSWDYRIRVRKPASLHLVGFLFASGVGPLWAGTGVLLSNSGHYNRSVLNPAIRVARARSRLWGYRPNRGQPCDLGSLHSSAPSHPSMPLAHLRMIGSQILTCPAVTVTSRLAVTVRHQLVALAVTVYLPGVSQTFVAVPVGAPCPLQA
jgi:hypothetical protein